MSAKTNNTKIGIFVLVALALLIAGLLAFGARSYFVSKTDFETAIPGQVYGLSVGSRVELRGVPIGKVTGITFAWNLYPETKSNFIVVRFEVEGDLLPLPPGVTMRSAVEEASKRGLRALVKSQGVTGTSLLALETLNPKENPTVTLDYKPDDIYIPSAPGQFTRMLDSIEKSLRNLQGLNFTAIGEGVTNVLAGVYELTDKLNELDLQSLGTNANSLLVELRDVSTKLQSTVEEINQTIQQMKLDSVSRNTDQLLVGLRQSNEKLQRVLDKLGTVPMNDTVGDVREAVQSLNGVLLELKQYPSGFIFGEPPPPAKSVQPPSK